MSISTEIYLVFNHNVKFFSANQLMRMSILNVNKYFFPIVRYKSKNCQTMLNFLKQSQLSLNQPTSQAISIEISINPNKEAHTQLVVSSASSNY
jgi:hypothetical protein